MAFALLLRGNDADKGMARAELQMALESILMWEATLRVNAQLIPFVAGLTSDIAEGIGLTGDFSIHSHRDGLHSINSLLEFTRTQCGLTCR